VVQIVELVAELIKEGKLVLDKPINTTATYHDPCRLNKRKNIHDAPRFILNSIPGLTFKEVDHSPRGRIARVAVVGCRSRNPTARCALGVGAHLDALPARPAGTK